jgi:hypothetical protein
MYILEHIIIPKKNEALVHGVWTISLSQFGWW